MMGVVKPDRNTLISTPYLDSSNPRIPQLVIYESAFKKSEFPIKS